MNIHHLELFYYVARHGGIMPAVHNIPYGIQQPAVSSQMAQLEEFMGAALFHRRPFALTPAGQELFNFIKPFFDNLDAVAEKIHGGVSQHLRIAASETVLREHLPAMLQELRQKFPKLKITLREGYHPAIVSWLQQREIDVSLGLIGARPPAGVHALALFKLPLVLLVPKNSRLKSSQELWQRDPIGESLITVPSNEFISRAFQAGLASLKVEWFSRIEVSSVELVQTYVANGYGIGVTVGVPKMKLHPQVRVLPLDGFELIQFGALWQGGQNPLLDAFLKIIQAASRRLMEGQEGGA